MNIDNLTAEFFARFGNRDEKPVLFFCPGRVNLIGEHTDYNDGYVLPCAIGYGTYLAARRNGSDSFRMFSLNFDECGSFTPEGIRAPVKGSWTNYPAGVINEFLNRGINPDGLDLLFAGDIPNGAGLSSSASIEMVTAFAINSMSKGGLSMTDLVKLSQHAENHFVGMNCGIMDQFAVGFGRESSAIFLDCGTLEYEIVPFNPGRYSLIIANTNKRRGLTDSKYNERRSECEEAVRRLQPYRKIDSLTRLTPDDLPEASRYINNGTLFRRARHVITENNRVKQAIAELKAGNLEEFGMLMNQSHDSLRDDYEVTGTELDTLVEEARKARGVIGSRMTGAGFGGCTVSLVESNKTDEFIRTVGLAYSKKTGLTPDFYLPAIADGVKQIL